MYTANFNDLVLPAGSYVVTVDEPASATIGIARTGNSGGTSVLYTTDGTTWRANSSTLYIRMKLSEAPTALNNITSKDLKVYYSNKQLVVNGLKSDAKVSLFTLGGKEILATTLMNGNNVIPAELSNGIYLLKVNNVTYKVAVK